MEFFRRRPDRFFGMLRTVFFVVGWVGVIYLAFFATNGFGPPSNSSFERVQILVSTGAAVTLPSAFLWGIAAYLWVQVVHQDDSRA